MAQLETKKVIINKIGFIIEALSSAVRFDKSLTHKRKAGKLRL